MPEPLVSHAIGKELDATLRQLVLVRQEKALLQDRIDELGARETSLENRELAGCIYLDQDNPALLKLVYKKYGLEAPTDLARSKLLQGLLEADTPTEVPHHGTTD